MYAGHEGGAYAKNSFGNMYADICLFFLILLEGVLYADLPKSILIKQVRN